MDRKAIIVIAVVSLMLLVPAQAPLADDLAKEGGVSNRATGLLGKITRSLFGSGNEYMSQMDCHWWFGYATATGERAIYINLVCGQIICPQQTHNTVQGATDISQIGTVSCGSGSGESKLKFYLLYGFMPFVVLMYIFKDMMLLFTFLTPRTANMISLCLAAYAVFLSHGIFSVVMGLMNFLGGPGSSFDFTQIFFSVLFFSLIFGFFFDSIFRFFIETSRVSKAIQYQMYEVAAETQLGKWRAGY